MMNRFMLGCMVRMMLALSAAVLISGCGSSGGGGGGGGTGTPALEAIIDAPSGSVTISAGTAVQFQGAAKGGTTPYGFSWNFGDGSAVSTVEDPGDKVFSAAGTYSVTLTVTDAANAKAEKTVSVTVTETDTNPTGGIVLPAGNVTVIAGQTVRFSGSASGGNAPLSFLWNFHGGAANATVLEPGIVTFLNPGIHTVSFTVTDADGDTADGGTRTVTVLADTQPTAGISTPSGNTSIVAGQSVNFTGTASGGNSPLVYVWNFGGGAPNSTVLNPGQVTFATAGTYTVTFSATDADGDKATSGSRTITVSPDTRPIVAIATPVSNTTLIAGQSVSFSATAAGGNGTLAYLWNFGGGATNATVLSPGHVTFATAGTYTVTFTATDSDNDSSSATRTLTVIADTQPVAVISAPSAARTLVAGQSVAFTGSASGGNAPLSYQWNFGGGAPNVSVLNPGNVVFSTPGTYTVGFTVTDTDGDAVSGGTRTITVVQDMIPTCSIVSPTGPFTLIAGQSVNFSGSASGGNPQLTYAWNFGGGAVNSTALNPGNVVFQTAGTFTVSFNTSDADGDIVSGGTRTITVVPDLRPTVSVTSPTAARSIVAGQSVSFTGSASGGNEPLTYLWNFGGGASNATVASPGNVTFNTPGTYTVSFTATDVDGDAVSGGARVITVAEDLQPTAAVSTPTAEAVTLIAGQFVPFQGSASGGNAPLTYAWNFGGGAANSTVLNPGNVTFATAGTYTVSFSVTDTDGDTVSGGTRTVTVLADLQPTARILTPVSEASIVAGQAVNFSCTASGGNEPLAYRWTFGSGAPTSTVKDPGAVTFAAAGIYTAILTVTDVDGDTVSGGTRTITVAVDTQPTASIPSPSADVTAVAGQSVNFQGSAASGNAPLAWRWDFGGGAAIVTVEDPGAVLFSNAGTFAVALTVTDLDGDTSTANRTVTVEPDTNPAASITSPTGNITLIAGQSASFQASVAGGNLPLTHQWNFGGGASNTAVEDPGAIAFNTAGTYTVSYTVTDRDGDTDTKTLTVTVEPDTLPVAAIVSPSNVRIKAGETVNFEGTVTGGNAGYTYAWHFGGGIPDASDEAPGDIQFNTEGTFVVTFTVTDADGDTATDTVTVSVKNGDDIYSYDFEAGWDRWYADNGIWEVGTPNYSSGPATAYGGNQCGGTVLTGNYPASGSSRLVSPSIVLPAINVGEEIHMRFWHWFAFGGYDAGYVQISEETSPGVWSAWTNISGYSGSAGVWTNAQTDLSSYSGKKIRISFYLSNSSTFGNVGPGWYVDDISIFIGHGVIINHDDTYSVGFESGFAGWHVANGTWQVGLPTSGPNGVYNGSQCAGTVLGGNYPPDASSYLISPTIVLPVINSGEDIYMRFWHWFAFGGYDAGYVQISEETSPGIWSAWTNLSGFSGSGGVWTNAQIDLSPYAGKKIRISFYLSNSSTFGNVGPGWFVDDISIFISHGVVINHADTYSVGFENGFEGWHVANGTWQVGLPTSGPNGAYTGSQCAGTVLGGNYPPDASSYLISPTIILPSIITGEMLYMRFWHWFAFGGYDAGYVQVSEETSPGVWSTWTTLSGYSGSGGVWTNAQADLSVYAGKKIRISFYLSNSSTFGNVGLGWYVDDISIFIGQGVIMNHDDTYTVGFENGFDGWYVSNGAWEVGSPSAGPLSAYSGLYCAGTVLAGNYPSDASSYLISPIISLPVISSGEELVLRFWQWFVFGGYDAGVVQISEETPEGWSGWTPIASYSDSSGGVWSYPLVDLSAYSGKKVRIAFYLSNSSTFGNVGLGWYIDDISIQIR